MGRGEGVAVDDYRVALICREIGPDLLGATLGRLAATRPPDPVALARDVETKEHDKHGRFLGPSLLTEAYAARSLDVEGTWEALREMVARG